MNILTVKASSNHIYLCVGGMGHEKLDFLEIFSRLISAIGFGFVRGGNFSLRFFPAFPFLAEMLVLLLAIVGVFKLCFS